MFIQATTAIAAPRAFATKPDAGENPGLPRSAGLPVVFTGTSFRH